MVTVWYTDAVDNPVGSRELLVAFITRKRQTLYVSQRQLEILRGCILGDAYVSPQGRVYFEHSTVQRSYLRWKHRELTTVRYRTPPMPVRHFNSRTGKTYTSLRFATRQFFQSLRSEFYPRGEKIFPPSVELTPLTLAVWYMDDGNFDPQSEIAGSCVLSTERFDDESLERIQNVLLSKYGIEGRLRKSRKLAFTARGRDRLFVIIRPHVVSSMRYKIR